MPDEEPITRWLPLTGKEFQFIKEKVAYTLNDSRPKPHYAVGRAVWDKLHSHENDPYVGKYLLISTIHLTKTERDALRDGDLRGSLMERYEDFYLKGFYYCYSPGDERPDDMSDTLWALDNEAYRRGCDTIFFEDGAGTLPGFPEFPE